MGCILYLPFYYQNVIIAPYHNFPEEVAKHLRRAVFYSKGPYRDVLQANKYYRKALEVANEVRMPPFSSEIVGVKIKVSELWESDGNYPMAIQALEVLRIDFETWMEKVGDLHWNDGGRTRILKKAVEFNVKLAEMYSNDYMQEYEKAEEKLVTAVEIILSEKQRREKEGIKQGEGEWMTDEEIGGTMEGMVDILVVFIYLPLPPHRFMQLHG